MALQGVPIRTNNSDIEEVCIMWAQRKSVLFWLLAAFLSFLGSVYLWFWIDHQQGLFVGLWVPSILALGALLNTLHERRG
jgi:drug/metabolite transporter superfamily protein YnfA